jgi:hypothetical protein
MNNLEKGNEYPFSNIDPVYIRLHKMQISEKESINLMKELKKLPEII